MYLKATTYHCISCSISCAYSPLESQDISYLNPSSSCFLLFSSFFPTVLFPRSLFLLPLISLPPSLDLSSPLNLPPPSFPLFSPFPPYVLSLYSTDLLLLTIVSLLPSLCPSSSLLLSSSFLQGWPQLRSFPGSVGCLR